MFASLRQSRRRRHAHQPLRSSTFTRPRGGLLHDPDEEEDSEEIDDAAVDDEEDHDGAEDDGAESDTPLLPLFEASQLDSIPVYHLTHAIRMLVEPRCETTLSWDQLRSPQVSQFLVKPIQQAILENHFTPATLYALVANCLQFAKEAATSPGISGMSRTRAMVSELLAIKLLKEYSTRELIDALSYDFFPLQGLLDEKKPGIDVSQRWSVYSSKTRSRVVRISTLEVAIRAQAKRFLAHPVVVQHLQAIWAGTIVFYSAADRLHRPGKVSPPADRGTAVNRITVTLDSTNVQQRADQVERNMSSARRTVTLYNPRQASLLKLSRLRVPRYRQFLSTCSLAVLLVLFVSVLAQRSTPLTMLEVVFWLWSAGFTLDEVVGFSEQGFNLYIMSFWNSFDLGILLILACYCCLRIVSLIATASDQEALAGVAYDLLAINAILLFPRLFSVLDHYRYFNQLLIAFRMMILDLLAVLILVVIACSGFFVAFSLSFGSDSFAGSSVSFTLFQILMGYSPAAWERWPTFNYLGKTAMVIFLCITQFLVVTILITVLTNSFMAIVRNAHDEHQFVFAVNTISMVKSDALFSYIAPTNVLAWVLAPLRFTMSFRNFVWLNRTVIKTTHFPVLFGIFAYERLFLSGKALDPGLEDDVLSPQPSLAAFDQGAGKTLFNHGQDLRQRERSAATPQDQALEEVFRRPVGGDSFRAPATRGPRRRASNINSWMHGMGPDGRASPPMEQDAQVLARLERPQRRRSSSDQGQVLVAGHRPTASDPEQALDGKGRVVTGALRGAIMGGTSSKQIPEHTDADGDDELGAIDEMEPDTEDNEADAPQSMQPNLTPSPRRDQRRSQPDGVSFYSPSQHSIRNSGTNSYHSNRWSPLNRPPHHRTASNTTILFNPLPDNADPEQPHSAPLPNETPPGVVQRRSPRRNRGQVRPVTAPRARAIPPPRGNLFPDASAYTGFRPLDTPRHLHRSAVPLDLDLPGSRQRSAMALDLASDLGDNKTVGGTGGIVPASFTTQFGWLQNAGVPGPRGWTREDQTPGVSGRTRGGPTNAAPGRARPPRGAPLSTEYEPDDDDAQRLNRLVLLRMNTLEAGFREVLHEVKEWRQNAGSGSSTALQSTTPVGTMDPSGGLGGISSGGWSGMPSGGWSGTPSTGNESGDLAPTKGKGKERAMPFEGVENAPRAVEGAGGIDDGDDGDDAGRGMVWSPSRDGHSV